MKLADFTFELPDELIAQEPPAERDGARMLVVDCAAGRWEERTFRDLPKYLRAGDCLVLNDTRVIPARLIGRREAGTAEVEVLLLQPESDDRRTWSALVRPGKKLLPGDAAMFPGGLRAVIVEHRERGERLVRLECDGDVDAAIDRAGHIPLPPYIRRDDRSDDRQRYQTVYANERGSAAAPTAGLHFTPDMLARCESAGAAVERVTLHVGLGTFRPLEHDDLAQNHLHAEPYRIGPAAWDRIRAAPRRVAVGTTSVRALESAAQLGPAGSTDLFITPGYQFHLVDAMLTNFHLPRSSLLVLVCAFAGYDLAMAAYCDAVARRFRFFSYGDCMLIL